jgi:hypothetical protein
VVNGSLAGETAKLAEQIGEIPAKSVPNFLVEVAEKKIANGEKDLEKYLLNNRDELNNLIEKWAKVPTIEENPDYYSDFGQNEHFSLKGRGLEMSIKNCTIFPIYLCTVFSVYFFNLDSADAVLYEFPKILTILE